jgi:hypothetical protein
MIVLGKAIAMDSRVQKDPLLATDSTAMQDVPRLLRGPSVLFTTAIGFLQWQRLI